MYPSIDKEEIMKIVNGRIEEKFGINKISETLISTSNLIINEDHFVFDNIVYRQKKGLPVRITYIRHFGRDEIKNIGRAN